MILRSSGRSPSRSCPHLADRDESRARFTREAKAVARLQHPNIVEVYDYAPSDSEQAYIVTEYIDGPTLRQLVDLHPIRHAEAAALLMIPVLEALQHAHAAGIVHRDVKPENIMLRPDGTRS
ncbi:MAG: protein kinase [bacterium]